jgi:two-component system sensor histidine kinase ChiS
LIATEAAHVSLAESLATRANLERTNARLEAMNDAFGRFVPRQFLNALGLHSPVDASLGARASASTTIMFADLRNFTSISEYLPAAEIFGFINRYLAHVAPRIRANEGFVVHYLGDGILALFHGPPDSAVRAAIEMQRELREAATSGALAGALPPGTELRLGIGLHFGHIEMGIVGESERWDSSIISDAVNTASRVEGLTKVFGVDILVTRAVMEQLHDPAEFEFRRLGYADVKGRVQRVDVYEVLNSLPESMRAARLETRAAFEQAVAAMERGEPAEAIFAACAGQHPDDVAAGTYAQRLAGQT